MHEYRTRRALRVGIFACAVSSTLAACSGGGGPAVAPIRGNAPVDATSAPTAAATATPSETNPKPSPAPTATAVPTVQPSATAAPTATAASAGAGSGSLAISRALLYVAEANAPTIDAYDPITLARVSSFTDVSTPSDTFKLGALVPIGVAVGPTNEIYVSGEDGYVRKYPAGASGNVKPIAAFAGLTKYAAGDGTVRASGIAVDAAGNLYGTDALANPQAIRIFSPAGSSATAPQAAGGNVTDFTQFIQPVAVAVDSARNVYVADRNGQKALTFNPLVSGSFPSNGDAFARRILTLYAGFSSDFPRAISVDRSGDFFVETQVPPANVDISTYHSIGEYAPTGSTPIAAYAIPTNATVAGIAYRDGILYASFFDGTSSTLARFVVGGGPLVNAQKSVVLTNVSRGIAL